jgi:hypothetical protein
MVVGGGSR